MTSPLPKQLRIGPYTWQVRCSKEAWKKTKPRPEDVGDCNLDTLTITLKPDSENLEFERVTLLHEILHACRYASGSAVDLNNAEESMIAVIDAPLYAVLHDNPDLLDYLGLT